MDHRLGCKSKTPYGELLHRDGHDETNKRPKRNERLFTPSELMTRQASLHEIQLICRGSPGRSPPTERLARDSPSAAAGGLAHPWRRVQSCDQGAMLAASLMPLIHAGSLTPVAVTPEGQTHGPYMSQPLAQYFQARPYARVLSSLHTVQPMYNSDFRHEVPVLAVDVPFVPVLRVHALPSPLASPTDHKVLSLFQVFLRMHIEVFCAGAEDIMSHTRGRNKKILLGQVGIRCRHCAHISPIRRTKGSTYFPATTMGFYQAGQNMSSTHLQCGLCPEMSELTKQCFATLLATKTTKSSSRGGRAYWQHCAKAKGLVDTDQGVFPGHAVPPGVGVLDDAIPSSTKQSVH